MTHRLNQIFLLTVAGGFFLFLAGPVRSENVALVNGQPVTWEKFQTAFEKSWAQLESETPVDPASDESKKLLLITANSIIEELITSLVLESEAKKLGLMVTSAEVDQEIQVVQQSFFDASAFEESLKAQNVTAEELRENIRERILKEKVTRYLAQNLTVTEDETAVYYQRRPELYVTPEKIELAHILFFSESRGQLALEEINNGLSFELAARKFSEDSLTRTTRGYLGWRHKKDFSPGLAKVVFALNPGEISFLVLTDQGHEIFQCLARTPQKIIAYEEVKDRIKKVLSEEKRQAAFQNWLQFARKQAAVTINEKLISELIFKKDAEKK